LPNVIPSPVARLVAMLETIPGFAPIAVSGPGEHAEVWNLRVGTQHVNYAIRWTPTRGFGLFLSPPVDPTSDTADETFANPREISVRIRQLVARPGTKSARTPMTLAELRQLVGVSQSELAAALNTEQSAVSTLENRKDLRLDILEKYVASLGGELVLHARFKDFEVRIEPATFVRADANR
jgi:helix-turn-helix protein